MKKISIAILTMAILFAGCGNKPVERPDQDNSAANPEKTEEAAAVPHSTEIKPPFTYDLKGLEAEVSKTEGAFHYTADELNAQAEECGSQHEVGYFDNLVKEFTGTTEQVYSFEYQGADSGDDVANPYLVTVLPNKTEYKTLDDFKKDFDICSAGGNMYPTLVSEKWLLFVNACGSGANGPTGCDKIQEIVEPSLKLSE